MKKSIIFLLFLSISNASIVVAESHASEKGDQVEKFENAVKFVSEKKLKLKKYAKYLKYLEDEHEFDDIPF